MADARVHPVAVKRKALKLFGMGHSAESIGRELGIAGPTVLRWAKKAKIEKGVMIPAKLSEMDDFVSTLEIDKTSPIVRIVEQHAQQKEVLDISRQTSTPAEQYQALVAGHGIKMLQNAFANPPVVKNMRDLKTLTEVVNDALGLNRKGIGGRLAIDLHILTKPQQSQTIVEATVISDED